MFGAVFGIASIVGPLLGGAFTTDLTWVSADPSSRKASFVRTNVYIQRWCFWINLPIGGVVMVILMFILKPTEPTQKGLTIKQQLAKLDLLGEVFLLPCIICLLLALQWGGSTYPFNDGRIIALFVLFGVLLIAFAAVQVLKPETATIPGRIVKDRSILAAMWFVFCVASGMMLMVFYIPIWLQAIKGKDAVGSGIALLPMVISLVIGSILAGQLVSKIGYYAPFMIISATLMPIGAGLITTFNLDTGKGEWIGYQILFGFGLGLGMQQSSVVAQTVLKKADVPTGVSLMFFVQMLSGAIFVSVGQNVLDTKLVSSLVKLVPGIEPTEIVNTGATDLRGIVPANELHGVLVAYNQAIRQPFIVACSVGCLAVFGAVLVRWQSVKSKHGAGKPPSEENRAESEKAAEQV